MLLCLCQKWPTVADFGLRKGRVKSNGTRIQGSQMDGSRRENALIAVGFRDNGGWVRRMIKRKAHV